MIGLDTNVLVRYLAQDDALQSPIATALIERRLHAGSPGFVSLVAMVELAWVLQRSYGVRGPALADVIERLLCVDVLVVEHADLVFSACVAVPDCNADFGDALIVLLGTAAGCGETLTFDRAALRLAGYAPIAGA